MTKLTPPQKIHGLTPYLCEYEGHDGLYCITLYGTDPDQILRDHGADLHALKIVGVLYGTIPFGGDDDRD